MNRRDRKPSFIPRHAEAEPGADIVMRTSADGGVTVSFSDGSDDLRVSRREFMRISGVAAAAAAMSSAACRNPVEHIVPYVDRPEETRIGLFSVYASVWNHTGILVKTRAGRPVKLEGNPKHPVSRGALSARQQASYMGLYDPDRAVTALKVNRADGKQERLSWAELDRVIAGKVAEIHSKKAGGIRFLTGTRSGSAEQALIREIIEATPDTKHYTYEPLHDEAMLVAAEASYGRRALPHLRFDKADVIVSFQSDFLGNWLSPVEFTKQFSSRRVPEHGLNKLIAFEGAATLTGLRADEHHLVRTSDLVQVALAVAHEIVAAGKGSFANDGAVKAALAPFTADAVSKATGVKVEAIKNTAADLAAHVGKSLVVAGGVASATETGIGLEAAVNLLNAMLEADGNTIERDRVSRQSAGQLSELQALIADINAGKVDLLIIADTNPLYTAPPSLNLKEAFGKVPLIVVSADRLDETAVLADYLATASHPLEAWGDSTPFDGVYSVQQPVIRPLYETRSFGESLLTWFVQGGPLAVHQPMLEAAKVPAGNNAGGADFETGAFYRYLLHHWEKTLYPKAQAALDFATFWESVLREGVWISPEALQSAPAFRVGPTLEKLPKAVVARESRPVGDLSRKELVLMPTIQLGDGAEANNGHLQELPDALTKTTWGDYLMVSPHTFKAAKLKNGDIVEIKLIGGEIKLTAPVIMQPGLHDDVVVLPLGYGRERAGEVANGIGSNAFKLSQVGKSYALHVLGGLEAEIKPTGLFREHAIPQGAHVIDLHERPLLSYTTIEEFKADPTAGIHKHPALKDLWEDHNYSLKWGMSVDLSKCTGCSACVIACQEENNIPVVGRQGVIEGREMHWIRVDRYFVMPHVPELVEARHSLAGDPFLAQEPHVEIAEHLSNPRVVYQPMMCQHCESAPCETVCPVLATMHSSDGLNQMAYNRCVGTRYCANNCPFKVRRFNWYNYGVDRADSFLARLYPELREHSRYNAVQPLPMGYNPEVTVRARGVMEKCTFCVQRIRRAKWEVQRQGRDKMRDGDVVTACQESCPADAISFGNLVDAESMVAKHHASPRALAPLGELGVESSVAYLTNVLNTKPEHHEVGHGAARHQADHSADGGAAHH
jgi:molybdopterin-containing oxidoreductase family iron-sulfur binding subunit